MAIVRVQKNGQITLPVRLRAKAGIAAGDTLEAKLERGKITLIQKSIVDRGLAEALEDVKQGRVYGPFDTHEEFVASLRSNIKKLRAKHPASEVGRLPTASSH